MIFPAPQAREMPLSIVILIKSDDTGSLQVGFGGAIDGLTGLVAIGGACFFFLIPEIAALPDARAQAGEGTDGGGVVDHIF
jgi:hypothetical protein